MVIGASAGGVEALQRVVGGLPADLPAAVLVVMHLAEGASSMLPRILDRAGPLEAAHPEDGDPVQNGRIYVAPPTLHLLLEDGAIRLSREPHENRHRPAVDTLFRSAAVAYGPRVVGVVLSGTLDDGSAGLLAIKRRGGELRGVGQGSEAQRGSDPAGTDGHLARARCAAPRWISSRARETVRGAWGNSLKAECCKDRAKPYEGYSRERVEGLYSERRAYGGLGYYE